MNLKQPFMLAILCVIVHGTWAQTTVKTENELNTAVTQNDANIQLIADIPLSNYLNIDGKTVTIDLNGHKLYRNLYNHNSSGHVIWAHNGSNLTLKSSVAGSIIEGGKANDGGAIHIPHGNTVTATGITFRNNSASNQAGVIWNNGTFTATNCTFTNNIANDGGAVYNTKTDSGCGMVTLTKCTFTGNVGIKGAGALANAVGATEMNIDGCTITGNTAGKNGGGIWNGGTLKMKGAVTVTGNTKISDLPHNVFLKSGTFITVDGNLTGSKIGVSLEYTTSWFTIGWDGTDPSTCFTADHPDIVKLGLDGNEANLTFNNMGGSVYFIERGWDAQKKAITTTTRKERYYTLLSGNYDHDYTMKDGYFVVKDETYIDGILKVKGNSNIILCDGARLKIKKSTFIDEKCTLNIFGQINDTGLMENEADWRIYENEEPGIATEKDVTINFHGGTINAKGGLTRPGIGRGDIPELGTLNFFGGNITATSSDFLGIDGAPGIGNNLGRATGFINIYGGFIQATGFGGAAGIGMGSSGNKRTGEVSITINGGHIEAYGGPSGSGIGWGDGDNTAPIVVNGGFVYAYGGENGNGMGGNKDGDGGIVAINGGIVVAKGGEQNRAIGPGKYGHYSLSIDGKMMVLAGNDGDNYESIFDASERKSACLYHSSARLEPCTHLGATYTVNGTPPSGTHTKHCKYCTTSFTAEKHTFVGGICSECRVEKTTYTVSIYLPLYNVFNGETYGRKATYEMVPGSTFVMPESPSVVSELEFAGWLATTEVMGEIYSSSYTTTGETLLTVDAPYTITGDVSFVARYKPLDIILFEDDSEAEKSNDEKLYKYHDMTAHSVTLDGLTLFKDGRWNTLCLPFSLSSFTYTPLKGATVKTLGESTYENGTLTLNFVDATEIEAGKPYIIKWDGGTEMTNPVFNSVTINNTAPDDKAVVTNAVTFKGLFAPLDIEENEGKAMLYLDTDNTLRYPNAAMTIHAFHSYFKAIANLGDVNGNGQVNVTDVTLLVNYILGNKDTGFIIENADINGDKLVNVSDVTILVDFILSGSSILNVVINGAEGITFGKPHPQPLSEGRGE